MLQSVAPGMLEGAASSSAFSHALPSTHPVDEPADNSRKRSRKAGQIIAQAKAKVKQVEDKLENLSELKTQVGEKEGLWLLLYFNSFCQGTTRTRGLYMFFVLGETSETSGHCLISGRSLCAMATLGSSIYMQSPSKSCENQCGHGLIAMGRKPLTWRTSCSRPRRLCKSMGSLPPTSRRWCL